MDHTLSGSSVSGISQARILEWDAISFSRGSSKPRDQTCVSCIDRQIPYHYATWEAGEGNGTPFQYSCLEGPMDGGAWKAAVHGVDTNRTRLSDFTFTLTFSSGSGLRIPLQCRIRGFDPWAGKVSWRRKWHPTPVFLPGKSHEIGRAHV